MNNKESDVNARIDAAISCTANGLTVADSTLYMQGGGSEFSKTIVNKGGPKLASVRFDPRWRIQYGGINPVGMNGRWQRVNE
jgi:hypothetical protein